MKLRWRKTYETGISTIDKQHKHLFELLIDISDTPIHEKKDKLNDLLKELLNYAKYHFSEEEKYWKSINLPQDMIDHHRQEHNYYVKKVKSIVDNYSQGFVLSVETIDFLKTWIIDHILGEDQEYVEYLKNE